MMRNDTYSKITTSKLFVRANGNIYSIISIQLFVIYFIHLDCVSLPPNDIPIAYKPIGEWSESRLWLYVPITRPFMCPTNVTRDADTIVVSTAGYEGYNGYLDILLLRSLCRL